MVDISLPSHPSSPIFSKRPSVFAPKLDTPETVADMLERHTLASFNAANIFSPIRPSTSIFFKRLKSNKSDAEETEDACMMLHPLPLPRNADAPESANKGTD